MIEATTYALILYIEISATKLVHQLANPLHFLHVEVV